MYNYLREPEEKTMNDTELIISLVGNIVIMLLSEPILIVGLKYLRASKAIMSFLCGYHIYHFVLDQVLI